MPAPIRVAVNARALERDGSPFARLTCSQIVFQLSKDPGLQLELVAVEPIPADSLPAIRTHLVPRSSGAIGEAWIDQIRFPRLAQRLEADVLLYLHPTAGIITSAPTVSWCGDGGLRQTTGGVMERVTRSLVLAGLRGAAAVLYPSDLPTESADDTWVRIAPLVPPAFFVEQGTGVGGSEPDLPDSYVLVASESTSEIAPLLAAWTWVESSLGDTHSLFFACQDEAARDRAQRAADGMGLGETVRAQALTDEAWPAAFRRAAVLLHAGRRHNAAALRWALAAGLPVAAPATPVSESILGPAGYLTAPSDARALGAACLTLLVEESVADKLRQEGEQRAEIYRPKVSGPRWADALRGAAQRNPTRPG